MADTSKPTSKTAAKTTEAPEAGKTDGTETNSGTPSPESTDTADTALAKAAGITEGEVKALRDDAGLNQSAGHESDIHAWAASPAGKAFKDGEDDRKKAAKDEEKAYKDSLNKDGLDEAAVKYREAVDKA